MQDFQKNHNIIITTIQEKTFGGIFSTLKGIILTLTFFIVSYFFITFSLVNLMHDLLLVCLAVVTFCSTEDS